MNDDFVAFILTHGRPDRVVTYRTLRKQGYTGRIVLVVDDEDKAGPEYVKAFGDEVLFFSKRAIAPTFDEGDNFGTLKGVIYARNACFALAEKLGVRYFVQLDDDYTSFGYPFNHRLEAVNTGKYNAKNLDFVFAETLALLKASPFTSIAFYQRGDFLGGIEGSERKSVRMKRKAMNSFFCDTQRPFQFVGRINEDVNTYTGPQRAGTLFASINGFALNQAQTQANAGGMTELYLSHGTYVKSFYSVMYCPSAVKVADMGDNHKRLHHKVNYHACAPKILRETHKKGPRMQPLIEAESEGVTSPTA